MNSIFVKAYDEEGVSHIIDKERRAIVDTLVMLGVNYINIQDAIIILEHKYQDKEIIKEYQLTPTGVEEIAKEERYIILYFEAVRSVFEWGLKNLSKYDDIVNCYPLVCLNTRRIEKACKKEWKLIVKGSPWGLQFENCPEVRDTLNKLEWTMTELTNFLQRCMYIIASHTIELDYQGGTQ